MSVACGQQREFWPTEYACRRPRGHLGSCEPVAYQPRSHLLADEHPLDAFLATVAQGA